MKKLLMSLILLGTFAAMSAKGDSYMYWMVEDAKYKNGDSVLFDEAVLYAFNKASGNPATEVGGASFDSQAEKPYSSDRAVSYDVSAYSTDGWSFYVELWNDGTYLSKSDSITYSQAYNLGAIYEPLEPSGTDIAKFSSFAVPEPTSGLLMLFGLCGLALKRKRA